MRHGTTTLSEKPGLQRWVTTVPPRAAARSRSPVSPLPAPARLGAASVVADLDLVLAEQHGAPSGAAVPDHVGDALAHRPREQLAPVGRHVVGGVRELGGDLGRGQRRPGAGELAGERQLAVAVDRASYVGQRVAREPLEVGQLGPRAVGVDVDQPVGQLGLHRDHGQGVAEDVVQVAGEPVALVVQGQPGVLLAHGQHLGVAVDRLRDAPDRQGRDQRAEEDALVAVPAGHPHGRGVRRERHDDRHQPGPARLEAHHAGHRDVDGGGVALLADRHAHHDAEHDQREHDRESL